MVILMIFNLNLKNIISLIGLKKAKNVQSDFVGEDDFFPHKIYDKPSLYEKITINFKKFLKNKII